MPRDVLSAVFVTLSAPETVAGALTVNDPDSVDVPTTVRLPPPKMVLLTARPPYKTALPVDVEVLSVVSEMSNGEPNVVALLNRTLLLNVALFVTVS